MTDPLQFLAAASERFAAECEKASAAQWQFRPEAGEWNMGDVAEHLTIANGNLAKRMLSLKPLESATDVIDDEIPYLFYRGDEPPNVATPTGSWARWDEHVEAYRASAAAIAAAVTTASLDFRKYGAPHPVFGMMDGVQWLMFAGAHTERHRSQLIDLRRYA